MQPLYLKFIRGKLMAPYTLSRAVTLSNTFCLPFKRVYPEKVWGEMQSLYRKFMSDGEWGFKGS